MVSPIDIGVLGVLLLENGVREVQTFDPLELFLEFLVLQSDAHLLRAPTG